MIKDKIKRTYIRFSHKFPEKSSPATIFWVVVFSLILHILLMLSLKPATTSQPSEDLSSRVKVNIVEKKSPKKLSELKQKPTDAPDQAEVFGHVDHKSKKDTVLSKKVASRKKTKEQQAKNKELKNRIDKIIKDLKGVIGTKKPETQKNEEKSYDSFLPSGNSALGANDAFEQDFEGSVFTLGQALDVNMKRHPLMSYFSKIRQSVELAYYNIPIYRVKSYMERHGLRNMMGQTTALVQINRKGIIEKIKIVDSSGHTLIDNHWSKILNDSGPYPPIPPTWKKPGLRFTYKMNYQFM